LGCFACIWLMMVLAASESCAQTADGADGQPDGKDAGSAAKSPQKLPAEGAASDGIKFDVGQEKPLLLITRQQLVGKRLEYQPVFELAADGQLTNRRGSRTEKTIQLTANEIQSILKQAVETAKFFKLDGAELQKQFTKAAVGDKSFRVKDQAITKIEVNVKRAHKSLAIRGYSLARVKLVDLTEFQKLAAVESQCEYLLAQRVVGDREPGILAAINAEVKKRNLPLPEIKSKDLRAAYERTGGRFQARYSTETVPRNGDTKDTGGNEKFVPSTVRIVYFIKSEGAEPVFRFFGNTGE
jgi:hypothetical protein